MPNPLLSRLAAALLTTLPLVSSAYAAKAPEAAARNAWAIMADRDVDFAIQWFKGHSILAVYPDPAAFSRTLDKARRQANDDLRHVDSFEGYRQTLKHFFAVFDDAHAYVSIRLTQTSFKWPGFLANYQGHRFLVAQSEVASLPDGTEITSCDGVPMADWAERIAPYERIIPGLGSTRARAAPLIFRDADSPFVSRPVHCLIGGKTVELDWRSISSGEMTQVTTRMQPKLDDGVSVSSFGDNGAWVRLGNFSPANRKQSDEFEALYKMAPALRDKSVIVFDVRGNGGGPYEWFMGVLRSLYGPEYVDYYARARMQISPVYRISKGKELDPAPPETGADAPSKAPLDGLPDDGSEDRLLDAAKARGASFIHLPNRHDVPRPSSAPASLVHARVIVLTDYGCGSACIGFVDELKRIPGVTQVGTETFVDSRTGTAVAARLPSGNGSIGVPSMTRDGRERNDNEPQKPAMEFEGDIDDTAAVQAWVRDVVLAKPAR